MKQEIAELAVRPMPFALRNVTRYRNRRPPNLAGKAVQLVLGKSLRHTVNRYCQFDRILPNPQILK